jgi:hypothetical protein
VNVTGALERLPILKDGDWDDWRSGGLKGRDLCRLCALQRRCVSERACSGSGKEGRPVT